MRLNRVMIAALGAVLFGREGGWLSLIGEALARLRLPSREPPPSRISRP